MSTSWGREEEGERKQVKIGTSRCGARSGLPRLAPASQQLLRISTGVASQELGSARAPTATAHCAVPAQAYMGKKISKAVVTVPAYFNDSQRQATKVGARGCKGGSPAGASARMYAGC